MKPLYLSALLLLSPPVIAQPAHLIIDTTEVLCAIHARYGAFVNGLQESIVCGAEPAVSDFYFISRNWYSDIAGQTDCNCDLDFDGLTHCEELALCTDSGGNDTDNDCLGDGLEVLLGLNPLNDNSDGDAVLDGNEDLDGDGILEKNEDFDQDALTNCQEIPVQTDPTSPDTDGDGWNDETEVIGESNPHNPASTPFLLINTQPAISLYLRGSEGMVPLGVILASPGINVLLPGNGGDIPIATVLANPPVTVEIGGQP